MVADNFMAASDDPIGSAIAKWLPMAQPSHEPDTVRKNVTID
jgi:hypothetical protein